MKQFDARNNQRRPAGKSMPGLKARLAAANMLTLIVDQKASIETLWDPVRGQPDFTALDSRDQSLAKAILLTTLRNKTRIEAMLKKCWNRKPPQKARFLIHFLEISAAQILFMDVPESAAVNIAVTAIRNDSRTTRFASFANAVLRTLIREKEKLLAATASISIFPDWMRKTLATDFGREKTAAISSAILLEPNVDIQVKSGFDDLDNQTLTLPGGAKRLLTNTPVSELPGFDSGDWWVQDIAAAQPVRLLGKVEGLEIADLCAAPGGKTMQLAAMGAKVTAVDISGRRLKRLQENLDRTGLNAEIVQADILDWQPSKLFDAVLLDAPCSATGTLRRHPDILWNTDQTDIAKLVALQKSLIEKSATFLKPGGILIYANCSIFKDEGENLIPKLNIEGMRFDPIKPEEIAGLQECVTGQNIFRSLPHYLPQQPQEKSGMDGFFVARFIRDVAA
ncbi:MAG: transcription antitermination factor NusB [Salaquimonas sp.]